MEHTPGPWLAGRPAQSESREMRITDRDGFAIAEVFAMGPDGSAKGNATLIAAAPEMLQALRVIMPLLSHINDLSRRKALALAAIAKAEGTPPC